MSLSSLGQPYGLPHMTGTSLSLSSTKPFGWATLYNTCWSILTSFARMAQPYRTTPLHPNRSNHPSTIPLMTMGTIIYCNTRTPSDHILSTLPHIPLSSPATWDPHNVVFPTHCVEGEEHQPQISSISSISSSPNDLTSTIHDPMTFYSRLVSLVQVHAPSKSPDELLSAPTFQSNSRHSSVTPADLSE